MSQVEQIKEATSIVEIIGERLNLTPAGKHFRTNCPFHGEKSPSFFVTEDIGMYKCFGCQEAGDVFTFLEKYEGMTFREALEYLADRAGITLENNFAANTQADQQRERIMNVLADAADYYQLVLKHEVAGRQAREYLKKRATTAETIKLFRLGVSGSSWDAAIKYLTGRKKHQVDDLVAAGLAIKSKRGRYFDRFRDRLMFPLKNHRGQIVGFSGRWLGSEDQKEAKYINSPETVVFHKSELLYGLSENLAAIKQEKSVIVVEGEFDMIGSRQAFVSNVVAIKGSALTENHAKLLKRYTQKVILALDMDGAGIEATKKALRILRKMEITLRVIIIPSGKDPDELATHDPKLWRETVKKAVSSYDFLIMAGEKKYDLKTIEGKAEFIENLGPEIMQIENAVEQDFYVNKIANLLGARQSSVVQDLKRSSLKTSNPPRKKTTSESDQPAQPTKAKVSALDSKKKKQIEYLLFIFFNSSTESAQARRLELLKLDFKIDSDALLKALVKAIFEFKPAWETEKFGQFLSEDLRQKMSELMLNPNYLSHQEQTDYSQEWSQTIAEIKKENLRSELKEINEQIELIDQKENRTEADEKQQEEFLRRIVQLQQQMKAG